MPRSGCCLLMSSSGHFWNGKQVALGRCRGVWRLGSASLVRRSDPLRALCRPALRRRKRGTSNDKAKRGCPLPLLPSIAEARARACVLGRGVELSPDLRGCDRRFSNIKSSQLGTGLSLLPWPSRVWGSRGSYHVGASIESRRGTEEHLTTRSRRELGWTPFLGGAPGPLACTLNEELQTAEANDARRRCPTPFQSLNSSPVKQHRNYQAAGEWVPH